MEISFPRANIVSTNWAYGVGGKGSSVCLGSAKRLLAHARILLPSRIQGVLFATFGGKLFDPFVVKDSF